METGRESKEWWVVVSGYTPEAQKKNRVQRVKGPQDTQGLANKASRLTQQKAGMALWTLCLWWATAHWVKYPWDRRAVRSVSWAYVTSDKVLQKSPGPSHLIHHSFLYLNYATNSLFKFFLNIYLGYGNSQSMQVEVRWQPKVLASHHVCFGYWT